MIDRIISLSVRHRWLVFAAGVALAVWGVYAVVHTPMDAIPDLSENQVIVFTDWPGHSPQEIEDQVTYPLMVGLQGMDGVRTIRSSSDLNFSLIHVIFEDGVSIIDGRRRVSDQLPGVESELPPGVRPGLAPEAPATGQIFWYTVEGGGYDLGRLRAIQDWYVRRQLAAVPGVAEVASVGGYPLEFQIEVDPWRLATLGISLEQVNQAIADSNTAVGGHVVQKAGQEYVVRSAAWIGAGPNGNFDEQQAVRDLEQIVVHRTDQTEWTDRTDPSDPSDVHRAPVRLGDIARIHIAPGFRRGVFEKDGSEVVGGVVMMRYGENPLEVTRRVREKIRELRTGLPTGVRIVAGYDRTPLIRGAVGTVSRTLLEAILTASLCVVVVLLHARSSLVIALSLPLSTLAAFVIMWVLRQLGVVDIQTNIMSLAGLAVSIGVLVDSSIVMTENVVHQLHQRYGNEPVRGDVRPIILSACKTVGRPIVFSVLIMLLSFLPVFALGGMEGKMFRPLAFTKSFALLSAAILSVTLVPAMCTVLVKGRMRSEQDNWLVRSVVDVYRPVLTFFLDRPAAMLWLLGATFLVGFAPLGQPLVWRFILVAALLAACLTARTVRGKVLAGVTLVIVGLLAHGMSPLGWQALTPLDEGTVMDMPITVPRVSVTQAADDLKARNMMFCRFPEVAMVMGKAGRAETPTDPAPIDMIETMISFRPREWWPKRKLARPDAQRQVGAILDEMVTREIVVNPRDDAARQTVIEQIVDELLPHFDALMREYAYHNHRQFEREQGANLARFVVGNFVDDASGSSALDRPITPDDVAAIYSSLPPDVKQALAAGPTLDAVQILAEHAANQLVASGAAHDAAALLRPVARWHAAALKQYQREWQGHTQRLDDELLAHGAAALTRLALEALLVRCAVLDPDLATTLDAIQSYRHSPPQADASRPTHHGGAVPPPATVGPLPGVDELQVELTERLERRLILWRKTRTDVVGFGGELDLAVQMPGWTNVWTMPIQNRVDMLATGVNTTLGVRVLGRRLDDVVLASERIAAQLKDIPGAADVVADPIRGKGFLDVRINRERTAELGLNVGEVQTVVETATGGKPVTSLLAGRERYPVRVVFPRSWREDEESLAKLPLLARLHRPRVGGATTDQLPRATHHNLSPPPTPRRWSERLAGYLAVPSPSSPVAGSTDAGSVEAEARVQSLTSVVRLEQLADVRITEGPATIKGENGLLRNYVRLNVRGRSAADFVAQARQVIAQNVDLPAGVFVEWTGQFEHQQRAARTLAIVVPLVLLLILVILYLTYHDLADALLMLLAAPGAVAGGLLLQWLWGTPFSVTVWVGYIACLGMATSTGIIMLVYLREAVEQAGGLEQMSLDELREAVMRGAVHRLRPKLLTEATTVIGLAPMLWANGVGAEIIGPMVVPVLGGILVADEVIDLFLPVMFFWVRRWRWIRLRLRPINGRRI